MKIIWITIFITLMISCLPLNHPSLIPTEYPFYAQDFTLQSLDGNTYTLSQQRGKWVIINFWATWCVPCVEEMPALQELANKYAGNMLLLGINQREKASVVEQFATEHGITFPLLLHPDDNVLTSYQVLKTPQTIIVNPNGELVWRQFGPIELETFDSILQGLMQDT